jgi:hypothetical protein
MMKGSNSANWYEPAGAIGRYEPAGAIGQIEWIPQHTVGKNVEIRRVIVGWTWVGRRKYLMYTSLSRLERVDTRGEVCFWDCGERVEQCKLVRTCWSHGTHRMDPSAHGSGGKTWK